MVDIEDMTVKEIRKDLEECRYWQVSKEIK